MDGAAGCRRERIHREGFPVSWGFMGGDDNAEPEVSDVPTATAPRRGASAIVTGLCRVLLRRVSFRDRSAATNRHSPTPPPLARPMGGESGSSVAESGRARSLAGGQRVSK